MSDYPKKIHECFKRTLLFESGKKVTPFSMCFTTYFSCKHIYLCNGTTEETSSERTELIESYPNGSRCGSCPFLKCGEYNSDIIKNLKTVGLISSQSEFSNSTYIFRDACVMYLRKLAERVKERCYLTFTNDDKRFVINSIQDMDFEQVLNLIIKMDEFCKENNIK